MKLRSYVTIAVLFVLTLALLTPVATSVMTPDSKCPCPSGTPPGRTCPCPSTSPGGTCPCPVCPCPGDGVTYDETKLR